MNESEKSWGRCVQHVRCFVFIDDQTEMLNTMYAEWQGLNGPHFDPGLLLGFKNIDRPGLGEMEMQFHLQDAIALRDFLTDVIAVSAPAIAAEIERKEATKATAAAKLAARKTAKAAKASQ